MGDRLAGKVAIITGAGQTPGETIGNGRATSLLFAREGAQLLLVDRRADSAEDTAAMVRGEGGQCEVLQADITDEEAAKAIAATALERFGRIDVLHNNVGIGGGDGGPTSPHRGELAPHHGREPHRPLAGVQARAAGHAGAAAGLDRQHLLGGGDRLDADARLQGVQGRAQRADPGHGRGRRPLRRAGQRHHAGAHGHADGHRGQRRRARPQPGPGALEPGRARCPSSGARAPVGTPPTRRCSWPATRRSTSPACCWPSTAVCTSRSAEPRPTRRMRRGGDGRLARSVSAELSFSVNVHPSDDPWDVLPSLATAPFVDGRLPHTRILSLPDVAQIDDAMPVGRVDRHVRSDRWGERLLVRGEPPPAGGEAGGDWLALVEFRPTEGAMVWIVAASAEVADRAAADGAGPGRGGGGAGRDRPGGVLVQHQPRAPGRCPARSRRRPGTTSCPTTPATWPARWAS